MTKGVRTRGHRDCRFFLGSSLDRISLSLCRLGSAPGVLQRSQSLHPRTRRSRIDPQLMPIKVLLADDSALVRSAIRRLLSDQPEILLIGETSDFAQTLQMTHDLRPDIVVLDLHMSDSTLISPQDFRTRLNHGSTRVLAISIWHDDETRALADRFGAAKLLDKVNLGTDLIPTILQLAGPRSAPQ